MGGARSRRGVFIKGGSAISKILNKPQNRNKTQMSGGVSKLGGVGSTHWICV